MRPLTYALFTLFGVTVIVLQGCQDQTSTAKQTSTASTTEPTASSTEQTSTASTTEPTASSTEQTSTTSTTEPTASSTEQTSTTSTTEPTTSSTEQTSTTSTTEPTASSTDSDSNNAALLPAKTQVDAPLVFCGRSSKGYNINAATCADCTSCGGDCHMVGDACVDGESACTSPCYDCRYNVGLSCQTYLSFRDEEKCQRCDLLPELCAKLTAEQCNYGSCSLKEGRCVACADDLAEEQCSEKKLQGYCTHTLDGLPAHQCKKTCDLCGTSLRGIGEKCEVRTGPSTPCAHTTMCVTENTNEQCKFGAKNCICVKEKDVGDDCGHTNGPPYKCIRSSACLVTATNDKCGENASTNTCSCVKIRDNGKDCGNMNGPPYPCIHQDLCVVTTSKTTACSKNASKGSCSCFRPTCASTGHTCQLPSSRKKAADNYSCDATSQKCTDKICCTSTTDTTTKKTTKGARSVTTEENGSPGMTILMACIMGGVALAVMTIGVGAFFYNKHNDEDEGEKKCKIGVLPQE